MGLMKDPLRVLTMITRAQEPLSKITHTVFDLLQKEKQRTLIDEVP